MNRHQLFKEIFQLKDYVEFTQHTLLPLFLLLSSTGRHTQPPRPYRSKRNSIFSIYPFTYIDKGGIIIAIMISIIINV